MVDKTNSLASKVNNEMNGGGFPIFRCPNISRKWWRYKKL